MEGAFRDPSVVANIALSHGVTALAAKVDDGGRPFIDGATDFGAQPLRIMEYLAVMQKAGIAAGLWGYHYGENLEAEAEMACRAINYQPDFYIVDWEAEFQRAIAKSGTIQPFAEYLQAIVDGRDRAWPDCGLFHAPLAQPRYWYPWMYKAFQDNFDGMMPQIYHGAMELPYDQALERSYDDYNAYGLMGKPIYPAGQAYLIPTQEVLAWGTQAVRVYGATGLSWWKLEDAYYNGCLDAIQSVPLKEDSMRRVNGMHPDYTQGKILPVGITAVNIRSGFSLLTSDTRAVLDIEVLGLPTDSWPVVIVHDGNGSYAGYLDGVKTRDQIPVYLGAEPEGSVKLEVLHGRAKVTLLGILEAG